MDLLRTFHRWKTRKTFGMYMSPEVVSKLLDNTDPRSKNQVRHFQYVLVHIDEAKKPEELYGIMTRIYDQFFKHGAIISSFESSLMVGLMGLPWPEKDSPEARQSLVSALLTENGRLIRVAHGQANGMTGVIGSEKRFFYGAIIPNFSAALMKLFQIEFGTAAEIP